LAELVQRVGPNARQLDSEIEKIVCNVGDQREISFEDVAAIGTRNKMSRAFALGDALGDRDLPRLLARLDEELWEVKLDPQKSEIGLLYGPDHQSPGHVVAQGNGAGRLGKGQHGL
jgi:hypothetical protein